MSTHPLVTIVTVTLNDASRLIHTLLSVATQTYPNIEYLVIDGGSNDGTVDLLSEYRNIISWSVSEPDSGPFNAMNKGIHNTHGDWVIFMNSGDQFYGPDVLSNLAPQLSKPNNSPVLIGAVEHIYTTGYKKVVYPRKLNLKLGMRFCHQSALVRADYHKQNLFNLKDGIAADYGLFLRMQEQNVVVRYTNQVISRFHVDGISSADYPSNVAREAALYKKYTSKSSLFFPLRLVYSRVAQTAKAIIPDKIVDAIRDIKK